MNQKNLYLLLCVLGAVIPCSQFIPWVFEHGLNLQLLLHELFANRISGFFALDVLVSSVVVVAFARREGKRLSMKFLWLPIVDLLTVGVSLALPLFLYLREGGIGGGTKNA